MRVLLDAKDIFWIVTEHGCMGVKIGSQVFVYSCGIPMAYYGRYRHATKKDFGQAIRTDDKDNQDFDRDASIK